MDFSVSEGQAWLCWVPPAQGPPQSAVQVSAGAAIVIRFHWGQSCSRFTTMAVGRPLVLTGCLLETSVSCHMGLFIGQLITRQVASIRASEGESIMGCPRWRAQFFVTQPWE